MVVDEIAVELHKELRVEHCAVMPENRFEMVSSGAIDLECGLLTNTAERRRTVAFSPTIFVTGVKLLVRRESGIRSLADLDGKTVVLTRGRGLPAMPLLSTLADAGTNLATSVKSALPYPNRSRWP